MTGSGRNGAITIGDLERLTPPVPDDLGKAGRRLWIETIRELGPEWTLDSRELAVLEAACRQRDDVALCEAIVDRDGPEATGSAGQPVVSPYLIEARQGRSTMNRLLASIDLPDDDDPDTGASAGRSLARQRWKRRG